MVEWIAIAVSTLALTVSAATAWRTLFRSGELRMTRPTLVYFGPDGGRRNGEKPLKPLIKCLSSVQSLPMHLIMMHIAQRDEILFVITPPIRVVLNMVQLQQRPRIARFTCGRLPSAAATSKSVALQHRHTHLVLDATIMRW